MLSKPRNWEPWAHESYLQNKGLCKDFLGLEMLARIIILKRMAPTRFDILVEDQLLKWVKI